MESCDGFTVARIGIIGLGTIGKAHWGVIRQSPQTELVAVADPTPAALDFARAVPKIKKPDRYWCAPAGTPACRKSSQFSRRSWLCQEI
jgi:hypothetical protein